MSDARDLEQLLVEADDIAQRVGHATTSAHLLLAIWATPCPAAILLAERGVASEQVLAAMDGTPEEDGEVLRRLLARTRELAAGLGTQAGTLHLLMAIGRSPESLAHSLLARCDVPLAAVRNTILSWYTVGRVPKQYQVAMPAAVTAPSARSPDDPGRTRASPALGASPAMPSRQAPPPGSPAQGSPAQSSSSPSSASYGAAAAPRDDAGEPPIRERRRRPRSKGASSLPHELDPTLFPLLTAFGRNLTAEAAVGRFDPVIGREREVDELVDILGKRRGNNPVLVGEAGVGKTAIVEGAALSLLAIDGAEARVVIELDMASLTAGTALRGSFSERLGGIQEEVRLARGQVVVFIDELHTVVGAGAAGEGAQDAANELKTALARGEFPCIGATTHDEFRRFIEADPALERRFTPVLVEEPSPEAAIEILRGIAPRYEEHHRVRFEPCALEAAATLSARYIRDRQLPDKAIQVMDLAGSRCRRAGEEVVDRRAIAEVVSRLARIPLERLIVDDAERLLRLEEALAARVVGHRDVIGRLGATLRRNHAGFSSHRPMGSFLFLGPTGVGKTELAKTVAEVLFGEGEALVRLDMSEFAEGHGVARLVGAPPGYVGHEGGGQLTETVRRRPACVLLFDEIEKAHREVQLLLLQILDEGSLTDSRGRRVDFRHTLVILTSNLGAETFASGGGHTPVGFGAVPRGAESASADRAQRVLSSAREQLPLELWNRIDERCVFHPLEREEVAAIARLLLEDSSRRLVAERQIRLHIDDEVISHLIANGGFDPSLGARPMRQLIQRAVEGPLAEEILRGSFGPGDDALASLSEGKIVFSPQRPELAGA